MNDKKHIINICFPMFSLLCLGGSIALTDFAKFDPTSSSYLYVGYLFSLAILFMIGWTVHFIYGSIRRNPD